MENYTNLLYVEIKGLSSYKDDVFTFDFLNKKNATFNDGELKTIINNIYVPTVIGIIGNNASGKTTAINILKWIIDLYVNGKDVLHKIQDITSINSTIQVEVILTRYGKTNHVIKYKTYIKKDEEGLYIEDETVYFKDMSSRLTRHSILDFNENNGPQLNRDIFKKLKIDDQTITEESILKSMVLQKTESIARRFPNPVTTASYFVSAQNKEKLPSFDSISNKLIQYLDQSIKDIELISTGNPKLDLDIYKATFVDGREYIDTAQNLSRILSSGTNRGIRLFMAAEQTLKTGGYLFVDEIEVSLHKTLVIDLIKLFYSRQTNPYSSTLILTTHYIEVVDSIRRTDSVYLCNKCHMGKLEINPYSNFITRNDIKKSEPYLENLIEVQTTPNYDKFMSYRSSLIHGLNSGKNKHFSHLQW
ncbi:MAG: ATP-binding protein [Tenericutes bacterium]|nr:ATP-binding protein [Mycoplasmatota bacterium]